MGWSLPPVAPHELQVALLDLRSRRADLTLAVQWVASVPSTMDLVAEAAAAQAPAGVVAIADQQTSGRGRRGHAWSSPAGAGVYLSYLARPTRDVDLVTLAAGVGVREGIATATGFHAELKWPNDVMVGPRKLAGLLAEGAHIGMPHASVVVGVGLNVGPAAYPPDVATRATNLRSELGRDVARFEVCVAVLEHLADALAALESGGADDILRRWRDASPSAVGTPVTWRRNGADAHGVTAGIDERGGLLVETASGLERVIAGELQWSLSKMPSP